ncbi:Superoxide dismutase [Minicystis rosea]|nr:Superoxide dismutase [Minicystis rosea]
MKIVVQSLFSLSIAALAACGGAEPPPATPADAPPAAAPTAAAPATAAPAAPAPAAAAAPRTIQIPLAAKSGSKLSGKATFTEVSGGVKVTVEVAGAPPGKIATHVHETGDCSSPDGKSAGGHFNPAHKSHGLPTAAERHLGDLGNIEVKADGTGSTEITIPGASLKDGDPSSYVGRAIIVHEKQDDGGQPVGNAGGRIGCGVIAAAK